MKYLKIIIFACIVLQTTFIFSQLEDLPCGFVPDASMYDTSKYSATVKSNFTFDAPIVFNVFFQVINKNGINPDGLTEDDLLANIAFLNLAFNQFNIFYKYRGFYELDDVDENGNPLYDAPFYKIKNKLIELGEYRENAINVYAMRPNIYAALGNIGTQEVVTAAYTITEYNYNVLEHEFGHIAGLLHTFEGTQFVQNCLTDPNSGYCIDNTHQNECTGVSPPKLNMPKFWEVGDTHYGEEENVTRDVTSSYYNANTKGDMVIDTPADFQGSNHNVCLLFAGGLYYISDDNIVDHSGSNEPYVDIDLLNHMSYYSLGNPNEHFTNGQGVRMRETIENNTDIFNRVKTEVASLYEPYAGEYYAVGPTTSNHLTKFQPGFDYTFIQCGGDSHNYGIEIYNQPTDYDNTSFLFSSRGQVFNTIDKFSLDFETMFHPNHSAIFIQQLNEFSLSDGGQPHKCYNNFNRSSIGGIVIKFEDDILNTNITIQQKNAQDINDNNLIQDLQQGLYKIEKNYDDGSKKETLIYKSDN